MLIIIAEAQQRQQQHRHLLTYPAASQRNGPRLVAEYDKIKAGNSVHIMASLWQICPAIQESGT